MVEMIGAVTTKAVDDDERAAREAKISVNFMVFMLGWCMFYDYQKYFMQVEIEEQFYDQQGTCEDLGAVQF